MLHTIQIRSLIGDDLRTRSFFRRDIEKASCLYNGDVELDFNNVNFMSRSVADELCNILEDHSLIKVSGMSGDVKKMYDIVVRGRKNPRHYDNVKTEAVELSTIKDMEEFFSEF